MVSRLNLASTPRGSRARICLVERDQVIDALLAEITGLANREILLPAPCFHLRFLLPVRRIVPELERPHGESHKVAGERLGFLEDIVFETI